MQLLKSAARRSIAVALICVILAAATLPVGAAPIKQDTQTIITSPTDGQTVNGIITISGSTLNPNFDRYELAYGPDPNPSDAWQPFAGNNQQVANGALGQWNTNVVADGTYVIRLRVIQKDSNYHEAFVRGIKVANQQPIGTPTSIPPAPTFGPEATVGPIGTIVIEQPPTNVPIVSSNPSSGTASVSAQTNTSGSGGVTFGSLIGSACVTGLAWTLGAFVLFGAIYFGRIQYKHFLRRQRKKLSHANSQSTPPSPTQ